MKAIYSQAISFVCVCVFRLYQEPLSIVWTYILISRNAAIKKWSDVLFRRKLGCIHGFTGLFEIDVIDIWHSLADDPYTAFRHVCGNDGASRELHKVFATLDSKSSEVKQQTASVFFHFSPHISYYRAKCAGFVKNTAAPDGRRWNNAGFVRPT